MASEPEVLYWSIFELVEQNYLRLGSSCLLPQKSTSLLGFHVSCPACNLTNEGQDCDKNGEPTVQNPQPQPTRLFRCRFRLTKNLKINQIEPSRYGWLTHLPLSIWQFKRLDEASQKPVGSHNDFIFNYTYSNDKFNQRSNNKFRKPQS